MPGGGRPYVYEEGRGVIPLMPVLVTSGAGPCIVLHMSFQRAMPSAGGSSMATAGNAGTGSCVRYNLSAW